MSDLFGRVDQVFAGGLSADSLYMTFPDLPGGGLGLLIQNINLTYSQQIRRIHELGPGLIPSLVLGFPVGPLVGGGACDGANPPVECAFRAQPTYYITSIPEGTWTMARIFGPNLLGTAFFRRYGNPCAVGNNVSLSGIAGCNGVVGSPRQYWDMNGFLIGNYNMTATAREMVIEEQLAGMYVGLNIRATGQNGAPIVDPAAAAAAAAAAGEIQPAPGTPLSGASGSLA